MSGARSTFASSEVGVASRSMVRVRTANLYGIHARPDAVAGLLDEHRPDVVAIQELAPAVAEVIAARYPYRLLGPRPDAAGWGVALRFPATFGVIPHERRAGRWARFSAPGFPRLEVVSMHLANPVDFPWWEAVRARREQLDALERHLAVSPAPCRLVVGDMNATPLWPAYRRLARGRRDLVARAAARSGRRPSPTWSYRFGLPRVLRIDHVFGEGVDVAEVSVVPVPRSDHAALIVEVVPA